MGIVKQRGAQVKKKINPVFVKGGKGSLRILNFQAFKHNSGLKCPL